MRGRKTYRSLWNNSDYWTKRTIEVFNAATKPGILEPRDIKLKATEFQISPTTLQSRINKLVEWGTVEPQARYGPQGVEIGYVLTYDLLTV